MSANVDAVTAMRHFLLCNAMKVGPFSPRGAFLAATGRERLGLASLSDVQVAGSVEDSARRARYGRAQWTFEEVSLAQCYVWPRMGGRVWAIGTAFALAKVFRQHEPKDSRVWAMVPMAGLFANHLQILVMREGIDLVIDDGSHRAVAMALAGRSATRAFVGSF